MIFGHKLHIGTPYRGKRFWTHKIGKQEVGIWWVKKRFPRYEVPIWSLWPNIKFPPSIVAEKNATKNEHICSMCIKINKVYDLLLVSTLYATIKFMICYWSEHCTVWPSLWFVTGQYTVCYDHFSLWFVTGQNNLYVTITYRNRQCSDQQQTVGLVVTWHSDQQQNPNLVVTHGVLTSAKS
jgi:hypothetical protein